MASNNLEARLVILAEDRTAAAFAAIEKRVAKLGGRLDGLSRTTSRMALSVNAGRGGGRTDDLSRLAKAHNVLAKSIDRMERAVRSLDRASGARSAPSHGASAHGTGLGSAGHLLGLGAGFGAAEAVHEAAKLSAERVHETVKMRLSGMSAGEVAEATGVSADLAAKTPAIGQTDMMHTLRNARSVVGTYEEAVKIMEPLSKLRVIAQAQRPGQDVGEDFDKLIKGLEIGGVTQKPKVFQDYMEGIAKGLNVFGDTLRASQFYDMFKYGRQATPGLSEQFILSTAPTLAQELGGSSYGKAVSSFNRAIVSGTMTSKAMKEMKRLGLVNADDLDKKGALKAGRSVHGWELAQSNPNEWVRQYLIPAMQAKGITDQAAVLKEVGTLFSNQMAAQLVGILATQQAKIDKDAALTRGAMGLGGADYAMRHDPQIAYGALKESLASLSATLGSHIAGELASPMASLAKSIAGYTAQITHEFAARDHAPDALTPEQRRQRRAVNKVVYGVDVDRVATDEDKLEGQYQKRRAQLLAWQAETDPEAAERWRKYHASHGGVIGLRTRHPSNSFEGKVIANSEEEETYPMRYAATERLAALDAAHRAHAQARIDLDNFNRRMTAAARFGSLSHPQTGAPLTPFIGEAPTELPMGTGSYFTTSRRSNFSTIDPRDGTPKAYGPWPQASVPPAAAGLPDLGALLAGKLEATIKPDQIVLNVPSSEMTINIKGLPSGVTATASVTPRAATGTSMPEAAPGARNSVGKQ